MCLIVFFDLISIYTVTTITEIGAFIAKLQAHPVFRAAIGAFDLTCPSVLYGPQSTTIWTR